MGLLHDMGLFCNKTTETIKKQKSTCVLTDIRSLHVLQLKNAVKILLLADFYFFYYLK